MVQQVSPPGAPPATVTLTIDGRQATVAKGTLVVEAAKSVGVDIPVFCYEPRLAPVGACRMCLVSIERMPKLQTACTTPVADGMVVSTRSPDAREAQSDVLGMLLANHPLDCPVCDKGGECPLQDTTFNYGPGVSTFYEPKRQFEKPIPLSPLIALDRERCIMCYRCVRFQREIAGDEALTVVDRGTFSEIAVSEGREFDSPFSGNTIELCPVGALTSIPFRFRARPWDLTRVSTICNQCAVGCNLNIEYRANTVLRLTARANPAVDDGWLCDRGRFTFEFVNDPGRVSKPLLRRGGELTPASWDEAFDAIATNLRRIGAEAGPEAVAGIIDPRASNEELYLFGKLFREGLGSTNLDHWPRGPVIVDEHGIDAPFGSMADLDGAGTILLIGMDLLHDLPVLHLRVRKAASRGARLVVLGGNQEEFGVLPARRYALAGEELVALLEGAGGAELAEDGDARWRTVANDLRGDGPVALLFGRQLASGPSGARALAAIRRLAERLGARRPGGYFGAPVTTSNGQGALDLGLYPGHLMPGATREAQGTAAPASAAGSGEPSWEPLANSPGGLRGLYLHGVDPLGHGEESSGFNRPEFLIVQTMTLTATAREADVVLPAISWAEKEGTLTNFDRRIQRLRPAIRPPGMAMPDWRVFQALGQRLATTGFEFTSPLAIWQELAARTPRYRGISYSELGHGGRQWARSAGLTASEASQ